MAISVSTANPGRISGVGNASSGYIRNTGVARPTGKVNVGVDYGLQGGGGVGYRSKPTTISAGLKSVQKDVSDSARGVSAAQKESNKLLAEIRALTASLNQQAYAPPIDLASINAQARKQAEASVNPLYTKRLNKLLARQATKRTRAKQDYSTTVKDLEDELNQTIESNTITRGRAAEDASTAITGLNTQEDRLQTAQGEQFDAERMAQAAQLATSGLTGSGIGQQQIQQAVDSRNVQEAQQGEDFDQKRIAETIIKARTFEDLSRSDVLAGKTRDKSKKAAKLNLDRLIEDISYETGKERDALETDRYMDLSRRTSDYARSIINSFIASIADPRQRQAAAQSYGGIY